MTAPEFSQDWFQHVIPVWTSIMAPARGRANLKFLEVGTFEGRSAHWLLENILTDPSCSLITIDTFEGEPGFPNQAPENLEQRARKNLSAFGDKVQIVKGSSRDILPGYASGQFDLVYIDGSHFGPDVLFDGKEAIRLTKKGGLIIFDDYEWALRYEPKDRPQAAIDQLSAEHSDQMKVMYKGYQIFFLRT